MSSKKIFMAKIDAKKCDSSAFVSRCSSEKSQDEISVDDELLKNYVENREEIDAKMKDVPEKEINTKEY